MHSRPCRTSSPFRLPAATDAGRSRTVRHRPRGTGVNVPVISRSIRCAIAFAIPRAGLGLARPPMSRMGLIVADRGPRDDDRGERANHEGDYQPVANHRGLPESCHGLGATANPSACAPGPIAGARTPRAGRAGLRGADVRGAPSKRAALRERVGAPVPDARRPFGAGSDCGPPPDDAATSAPGEQVEAQGSAPPAAEGREAVSLPERERAPPEVATGSAWARPPRPCSAVGEGRGSRSAVEPAPAPG